MALEVIKLEVEGPDERSQVRRGFGPALRAGPVPLGWRELLEVSGLR